MITHDAKNAEYAQMVIHLSDGKISEDNHYAIAPAPVAAGE
jgi:ABC-type lipoprotein export system ATPase subunit